MKSLLFLFLLFWTRVKQQRPLKVNTQDFPFLLSHANFILKEFSCVTSKDALIAQGKESYGELEWFLNRLACKLKCDDNSNIALLPDTQSTAGLADSSTKCVWELSHHGRKKWKDKVLISPPHHEFYCKAIFDSFTCSFINHIHWVYYLRGYLLDTHTYCWAGLSQVPWPEE